jgi:hypothetical protein
MNHTQMTTALRHCRPDSEWQFLNDEFIWLDKNATQPTEAELDVAYKEALIAAKSAKTKLDQDKAALLAKLGITDDEAKLLLS